MGMACHELFSNRRIAVHWPDALLYLMRYSFGPSCRGTCNVRYRNICLVLTRAVVETPQLLKSPIGGIKVTIASARACVEKKSRVLGGLFVPGLGLGCQTARATADKKRLENSGIETRRSYFSR